TYADITRGIATDDEDAGEAAGSRTPAAVSLSGGMMARNLLPDSRDAGLTRPTILNRKTMSKVTRRIGTTSINSERRPSVGPPVPDVAPAVAASARPVWMAFQASAVRSCP